MVRMNKIPKEFGLKCELCEYLYAIGAHTFNTFHGAYFSEGRDLVERLVNCMCRHVWLGGGALFRGSKGLGYWFEECWCWVSVCVSQVRT